MADDDEDADELDDAEDEAPDAAANGDDLDPDEYDFDDEDGEVDPAARAARRKKIVLIGGGGTLAVLLLALVGLIIVAGDDGDDAVELPESTATHVVMALPGPEDAKPAESRGGGLVRPPLADRAAAQKQDGNGGGEVPAPVGTGQGLVIPSVTAASFSSIPSVDRADPLRPAPVRSMVESGPNGLMPKLSPEGRRPWQVYARPHQGDPAKPKVGVIVGGLGLARASTLAAIEQLPAAVTLAFDPYGSGLDDWVSLARSAGHEVMIGLPLEPTNFPVYDPGPYALLTDLDQAQNMERLRSLLSLMPGYTGMVVQMGSQFLTSDAALGPVLDELNKRGLMIVETQRVSQSRVVPLAEGLGMPYALVDVEIDEAPSRTAIPTRFTELESLARQNGRAIGIAEPLPITIRFLAEWSLNLPARNIELVPVSSLATVPQTPQASGRAEPASADQ